MRQPGAEDAWYRASGWHMGRPRLRRPWPSLLPRHANAVAYPRRVRDRIRPRRDAASGL